MVSVVPTLARIVLTVVGIVSTKVADTLTMVFDSEKMVVIFVTIFYKINTMVDILDTKVFGFQPMRWKIQIIVFMVKIEVNGTLLIF